MRPGRWVLATAVLALAGSVAASSQARVKARQPTVTVYKTPT